MAVFKANEASNYGGSGGSGFFSIAEDKETKQIRIMYDNIEDVEGVSVHKVKVGDRDRYVNCPRNYDDPEDMCPFCKVGIPLQARLLIPVYNVDEDAVQIWDRGKTMFQKMAYLCDRFAKDAPLVSTIFDVQRIGKPKDKKTTYEFCKIDSDNVTFDDLPDLPTIVGGVVLDKSAEEMEEFLDTGSFPDDSEDSEQPTRRRGSEDSRRSSTPSRRTPSRREERF